MPTDRLLTLAEVAEHLQVSPGWVRDHALGRRGVRLDGAKLGKYWRFKQEHVDALIQHSEAIADQIAKRKPRRVA